MKDINYDYNKVESLLIKSINEYLDLYECRESITAIGALNAFYKHYNEVSLHQLYLSELNEGLNYPDGDISVSMNDEFNYSDGEPKFVHRNLEFQNKFYGYFENEVVELRLNLFYKPEEMIKNNKDSFYLRNEKILDIEKNEWFKKIKDYKLVNYKIDVNFNA